MYITVHAAERFLQRVMSIETYTSKDVNQAMKYLGKVLQDVVITARVKYFVLPGFENFKVIYREGTVITIIPKGDRYVK